MKTHPLHIHFICEQMYVFIYFNSQLAANLQSANSVKMKEQS